MTEETLKPVAWMWTDSTGCVHVAADRPDIYETAATVARLPEPLYDAAALAEKDKRIAELERERDAAFTMSRCECDVDECCFNLVKHIDRATSAEASAARLRALLAEARKVVEPFANVVKHDISTDEDNRDVFRPMPGQYARAKRITVGHLRAARSLAEKLEKEIGNE